MPAYVEAATGVDKELTSIVHRQLNASSRSRLWVAVIIGVSLSLLSSYLSGDFNNWFRHIGPFILFHIIIVLFASGAIRRWHPIILITYCVLLCGLTVLTGTGMLVFAGGTTGGRASLFLGNANLLGAGLAVAAVATQVTLRGFFLFPILIAIFAATAILFTGSRLSLAALVIACIVWWFTRDRTIGLKRTAWVAGLIIACSAILMGGFLFLATFGNYQTTRQTRQSTNLLANSSQFTTLVWRTDYARSLTIVRNAHAAPFDGSQADFIEAQAHPDSVLLMYQALGKSHKGRPYTASIYLRSDYNQRVTLSTQLARITCSVGPEWTRCVTPVGIGDGQAALQFRLEAFQPGGGISVYAWGAQLEVGETASRYIYTADPLWTLPAITRLTNLTIPELSGRVDILHSAWKLFLASPVFGHGTEAAPLRLAHSLGGSSITHAHNALLFVLNTQGVLGFIAWAIVAGVVWLSISNKLHSDLYPLIACLFVLNMFDVTIFHSVSLVPAAMMCGYYYHEGAHDKKS